MDNPDNPVDWAESPKIQELRTYLTAWLTAESWTHEELIGWLKGHTLPALGYEDFPYDWILRAFPPSDSIVNYRRILTLRIAEFLRSENFRPRISSDDRLHFNLFYLCANLNQREELAQPLEEIFDFFQSNEPERSAFFSERKMYNLNAAFREALISNQRGAKYLPFWKMILEQQQPPILRGNIFSGFLGVLSASQNNEPLFDEIGWALGKMAEYFVQTKDKKAHAKFKNLLVRVREAWGGYDWGRILILQTIKNPWQNWATVRLPRLVMPVDKAAGGICYIIWNVYLPFLKQLELEFDEVSNDNIFSKILIPSDEADALEEKLSPFEKIRLRTPFKNYDDVAKVAREYLYMSLSGGEDYSENESLTEIRIDTYQPATVDPSEKEEKKAVAQKALAQTANFSGQPPWLYT